MFSIFVELDLLVSEDMMFYDKNQQVFNPIHIACVKFSKEYTGFVKGDR